MKKFFTLKQSPSGSFPKALSAQGNQEARSVLIERNLCLAAPFASEYLMKTGCYLRCSSANPINRFVWSAIPGNHFKLGDQDLRHKVLGQCALELGGQTAAFPEAMGASFARRRSGPTSTR